MLAKRKSDGKQIEIREWRGNSDVIYSTLDMNEFYQASDLDFLPEKETAVLEGFVARDQSGYLVLHYKKPHRTYGNTKWYSAQSQKSLPRDSFPSVTWLSEPKRIRITVETIDE